MWSYWIFCCLHYVIYCVRNIINRKAQSYLKSRCLKLCNDASTAKREPSTKEQVAVDENAPKKVCVEWVHYKA